MEELRMYIVVNADAGMRAGKIGSQVGHAVMMITEQLIYNNKELLHKYKRDHMAKIILKADAKTIEELSKKTTAVVYDLGRTQVESGTLTAIAFMPMYESERDVSYPELKKLKLL